MEFWVILRSPLCNEATGARLAQQLFNLLLIIGIDIIILKISGIIVPHLFHNFLLRMFVNIVFYQMFYEILLNVFVTCNPIILGVSNVLRI